MREEILAYYAQGKEDARLRKGGAAAGRLEFWRTQDVLRRLLPAARVLDVGGGSGVHAEWLRPNPRSHRPPRDARELPAPTPPTTRC
nr:hypothetical protein [Streptomyces sp. NRRL S-646]